MKKLILILLAFTFILSCDNEDETIPIIRNNIDEIRSLLSDAYPNESAPTLDNRISKINILDEYLAIPFSTNRKTFDMAITVKEDYPRVSKNGKVKLMQSKNYRFIIASRNASNEFTPLILYAFPKNWCYAYSSNPVKFFENFTGIFYATDLDSTFLFGYSMFEGVIDGQISNYYSAINADAYYDEISGSKSELECDIYILEIYYQDCIWSWDAAPEDPPLYCESYIYSEVVDIFEICSFPPPDDGGGGGGPSNPSSPTGPYSPQPGDKFSIPELAPTMETQVVNLCVPSIMEYINHELCNGTINQGEYVLDYLHTYQVHIIFDGVDLENLDSFVQEHFTTSDFDNFTTSIDQGNIVMADIASTITGSNHNVAVVGYHADGKLIYMDPELGSLQEGNQSEVGLTYGISISGCVTNEKMKK